MKPSSMRSGFTLLELLVVLLVCLVVFALVIPQALHHREMSRLSRCKGRLKQLGLALHNYHDTHQVFPPGYIAGHGVVDTATGDPRDGSRGSWAVFILPFINEEPLYNQLQVPAGDATVPSAGSASDRFLSQFICPSDQGDERGPGPVGQVTVGYSDTAGHYYARSNFVAVNGASSTVCTVFNNEIGKSVDGVFGHSTSVKILEIFDGTSNTFLLGERDMTKDYGAIWMRATAGMPYQAQAVLGVTGASLNGTDLLDDPPSVGSAGHGFGSVHREGSHFLLADGSVQFFDNDVDQSILRQFGALAQGAPIPY